MLLATNFELISKLISVLYVVVGQVLLRAAMLNVELGAGLHGAPEQGRGWAIWRQDLPNSVVVDLGSQAHLLVPGESSKDFRSTLSAVQVQGLVEDVGVSYKTYRLSIFNFCAGTGIIDAFNRHN